MSARLRGLSPNDTLVLINGKRRHSTGNLHVLSGQYQGAATADLDMIPVAAIDHVEVLQEGAAAQYGTDAIAGVVNIILKRSSSGGMVSATGGQYFQQGGDTYDFNGNFGIDLGGKGFLNISAEKRYRGFSQRGAQDIRLVDAAGHPRPTPYNQTQVLDYPNANHIVGDPESMLTTVVANFEYDLEPDLTLYANATYGERQAKAYENVRLPNRITAAAGSNRPFNAVTNPDGYIGLTAAGTPNLSGSGGSLRCSRARCPVPQRLRSAGSAEGRRLRLHGRPEGRTVGWKWDLSGTYGKDRDQIYTLQSANGSLFQDTHTTPTDFYDGSFTATEATFNLDVTKDFNVGLASPLTVAFGGEGRENTFAITKGDFASTYKEGGRPIPASWRPTPAPTAARTMRPISTWRCNPIQDLSVELAGRFEHYTDFGDAQVGKITARYDFTPEFAVRGTISTGFRAPTIQEEFYSATNVSPPRLSCSCRPTRPPRRSWASSRCQPEASTSYSAGIVAHPFDNFSLTVDAYSISLRNRIVGTGSLYGSGGTPISPTVPLAIAAHGNVLDPTVTFTGVTLLLNGISTLTKGWTCPPTI